MATPNNPFRNPFYNRFNDPVTRRHDEMETYAWLREHDTELRKSHNEVVAAASAPARSDKNPSTDYKD